MAGELGRALAWLVDAPLFIDVTQVEQFHDAVIQPEFEGGTTELTIDEESVKKLSGKLLAEMEASPAGLSRVVAPLFAFLNLKGKVGGEIEGATEKTTGSSQRITLHPIKTPLRRLVQLTLYYLANHGDRLLVYPSEEQSTLPTPEWIQDVPRALAFIDFPPEHLIVPMAAEFANGKVIPIYRNFEGRDGSGQPAYPEGAEHKGEGGEKRLRYWRWFAENVTPKKAMVAVERAAEMGGRIRWIDYRLFLDATGSTLHLHLCPSEQYDTGTFAYNLVKRGYEHGFRLVGSFKSEPDVNVFAIYEK